MSDAVILVRLVCGCQVALGSVVSDPYCQTHQERRVAHVSAPKPRIRAVNCEAKGPLVTHG